MTDLPITASRLLPAEPLARHSDLDLYRQGLARHLSGEWDAERFTAFRVRFGVYGQRQPGVQMVRIKIPGGLLPASWLRPLAAVNRQFAKGDAHITTRQDIQIYHVPLEHTAEALALLYGAGLTTREACGNTVRNITACALSGICPREHVDAGETAERLALSWLRAPLAQHMPRKVKMAVSGCATDCGAATIHDLAFIAQPGGFRVLAGGGLGSQPRAAVTVFDRVAEKDLPVVVEALLRLHQRYSDRVNRNASRVKFLVKRFGTDRFVALLREEFETIRGLPQRPWQPLDWRSPAEAARPQRPIGSLRQPNGRIALIPDLPLGIVSSDQLEALADIAEAEGIARLRTTRDQTIVLPDILPERAAAVVARLAEIGLRVPEAKDAVADVISCPGTTTCRIGITSSQTLAAELLPLAGDLRLRVSGCQNSCGLHHIGDIGLHGIAKKIDGRSAPHYQLHLGGSSGEAIGLSGPVVPARRAPQAVALLRDGYAASRHDGETLRGWAERLGRGGLSELLAPLEDGDSDGLFVDWGEAGDFQPPATGGGDCAAPFARDLVLADLADDALIRADRGFAAGRLPQALEALHEAADQAARRLLLMHGQATDRTAPLASLAALGLPAAAGQALDGLRTARALAEGSGRPEDYREATATWLDAVAAVVTAPPPVVGSALPLDLDAYSDF